jgi:hypothetical protein
MSDNIQTINGKQYKMISTPSKSKKIVKDGEIGKNTQHAQHKTITESLLVDSESESIEEIQSTKNILDGKKTKRIPDADYKKPKDPALTYLNGEAIKEKLRLYTRIMSKDLVILPLGCRVKYIEVIDRDTFNYKTGGVIIVNEAPKYLVLASNRKSWSVQLENTIIFREKFEMMREEYVETIKKLNIQLKKAHSSIARFNAEKQKNKKKKDVS